MSHAMKRKELPIITRLLLLIDIEGLGRKGEIVTVRPGYARNFLVPKAMGVVADRNSLKHQARLQEERARQAAADREFSEALAGQVHGITLKTHVKVDPEGHMYGSVSSADIVHLLEVSGFKVEKGFIRLAQPIRTSGLHVISLKLKEGITCSFKLKVLPEGMDELPELLGSETAGASDASQSEQPV